MSEIMEGGLSWQPIRKILLGQAVEQTTTLAAMRNPEVVNYFIQFAEKLKHKAPFRTKS